MCKVLIINSPLFRDKLGSFDEDSLPPIGLGYIATCLQSHSIDVELIDAVAENLSLSEIVDIIQSKQPQFAALNIFSTNMDIVKEIVESVESCVNFIIGGLVTRHIYENILEWKTSNHIDIVIGEGDYIIYDIVTGGLKEAPLFSRPGRRVFKVFQGSVYFPADISNIPLNRSFFKNEPIKHIRGFTEANIITGRGCIYNCAFCGAARSLNMDTPVREKTSQSIIDEINGLASLYPQIDSIRILDDIFLKNTANIEKAIGIFKAVRLNWRCMAHVASFKNVPERMLGELRESGCRELFIGIESGSTNILKMIRKTDNISLVKDTLFRLFSAGINVKSYFIYGFPGESEEDFKATYELAGALKRMSLKYNAGFRISVFQFRPYHGTELYTNIQSRYGDTGPIKENSELSRQIGRRQFNFCGRNYTRCDEKTLMEYIKLTNSLNNAI